MIGSFRGRDTKRFAEGKRVAKWEGFRLQAEKRLRILEAATSLSDLAALNSNRLEALKGTRKVNTRYVLMGNGVSASNGRKARPAR
jgi:toxin HigB-1